MIHLHPLVVLIIGLTVVNSEFLVDRCDMYNNYMANSTYQANLNLLQSSLLSSIIPSGFSNYTIGEYPDQVFGLALCRGDVSAESCQSCLRASIEGGDGASTRCPYGKAEIIWYDQCFLRYSNTSFFSTPGHVSYGFCNLNDVKYPQQFNAILHKLMNYLASQAANSSQMFAAGFMNYASSSKLYGLAQCTRDLSKNDCHRCLREFVAAIPRYCYRKFGGRLLGTSCNIRYESYLFYDDSAVPNAAATVTANTTTEGNSDGSANFKRSAIFVGGPIIATLVILLAICAYLRWARKKHTIGTNEALFLHSSTIRFPINNFSGKSKLGPFYNVICHN